LCCEFSVQWLFVFVILATIIQDELKVQKHTREESISKHA